MNPAISIIIPTLNEAGRLGKTLVPLRGIKDCEVIVVDGGSRDATLAIAQASGCRTLSSPAGRSRQMNCGAAEATGEVLLFLHADTLLPENFPGRIFAVINQPAFAAGAFSLAIDSPVKSLAVIACLANLRSRLLQMPYGDQALFTTRTLFNSIGGFPDMIIMEDFVFIREMKKKGKIIILPEHATTSARRWQNMGIIRTTLINQLMVCGYSLGVPSKVLSKWYRRLNGVDSHRHQGD